MEFREGKYITQHSEINSSSFRDTLRHSALSALATLYKITGQMPSLLNRNRIQFLYLHHVFEDEVSSFSELLQKLSIRNHFISYSEAVDRICNGNIDKPYITISFDDGLKSCLRAAKIMNRLGIKSCFFLCGSMLGETNYQKIAGFCLQRLQTPPMEFMSWDDVEMLLKQGHEIGSHTMTHPNLAQLSLQQIQDEITDSFDLLTEKTGAVKHFSWPLGRFFHFSPTAARITFETGFKSCASAERGCHVVQSSGQSSLCLRRDHTIAKWPVDHILYFMARNSRIASSYSNLWPQGWLEIMQGESKCV